MVERVRERPRQVDPHPAEPALLERDVQRRLGHGRRVERRRVVADPERELGRCLEECDLDRAGSSAVAVADDVAHELVDGLDEVIARLGVASGGCDLGPDERADGGQLIDPGDRDGRGRAPCGSIERRRRPILS